MYATTNFKSKAEFKKAVAAGKEVGVYSPGFGTPPTDGVVGVEGPWYPKPHTWYARVTVKGGVVTKVA